MWHTGWLVWQSGLAAKSQDPKGLQRARMPSVESEFRVEKYDARIFLSSEFGYRSP